MRKQGLTATFWLLHRLQIQNDCPWPSQPPTDSSPVSSLISVTSARSQHVEVAMKKKGFGLKTKNELWVTVTFLKSASMLTSCEAPMGH